MRCIIAGGRDFNNYNILCAVMNTIKKYSPSVNKPITEIVTGDARGADTLGAQWATAHDIHVKHFPANWDEYGKTAGFIRNAEMADYADVAICFWDGKSKGTAHMIKTMKMKKKPCYVYDYEGNKII